MNWNLSRFASRFLQRADARIASIALGVSVTTLAEWHAGTSKPTQAQLDQLADWYQSTHAGVVDDVTALEYALVKLLNGQSEARALTALCLLCGDALAATGCAELMMPAFLRNVVETTRRFGGR